MYEPGSFFNFCLTHAQKSWIQERIRLEHADTISHDLVLLKDSGWRLIVYCQENATVGALVRVNMERRHDEQSMLAACIKWCRKPLCDRILARPCPVWCLEDYDEAYIFAFRRGELFTVADKSELRVIKEAGSTWDDENNFLALFHRWERDGELRASRVTDITGGEEIDFDAIFNKWE